MIMSKVKFIVHNIFKLFLFFLLGLIWIRFIVDDLSLSFFLSFCFALLLLFVFEAFSRKKRGINQLRINESKKAEDVFLSLSLSKKSVKEFNNIATKNFETKIKKEYIVLNTENNTVIFPFIEFKDVDKTKIIEILNKTKIENPKKIVIPCYNYTSEILAFVSNFDVKIILLNRFETFQELYKKYSYYPEISHTCKKEKKPSFQELLAYSFNKKRTKAYLFSALILFFSSLFVSLSLYYCISASVLILFAIISLFSPFNKGKNTSLTLN